MANDWRETYKKLKKRKEAIDKSTNDKELNQAKQSFGRTGQSLYTGKAIGALNSNQTPSKKITTTKKKKDNDRVFSAFDDGYDIGDISKTILKGGKKVGNFIGDEIVAPIKDSRKNYQFGKLTEDMGMEAYKKMMGEDNEYDKLKKKYDKFITDNPDLINDANLLDQTIQTLPNQVGALKSGIKGGGVLGTVGAILGAGVGAATTGGAGTGAGAITGAKLLGGAGYVTGSAEYTYKLEAGLQYQTLIEMGVPEDIAREESKDTGAVNALIEGGESILDLVTFGGVSAIKGTLTKGLVKKYGSKTVAGWVGENVVKNAISEGIEEGLQETTSIRNEKQAMERAGLERDDSLDKERIKESVIAGGFAGGVMGGGTSVITGTTKAGLNTIQNKKNTQIEDITPNQVQQEIQKAQLEDKTAVENNEKALKNEKTGQNLRQQNYQYIPKDTDSEQRRIISEDASKYANNTPRTQEFIDLTVNTSEASGSNFRLANNEAELIVNEKNKLIEKYAKNKNVSIEEATERFKNTTIDAYNNNGEIVINIDSPKALNRLVGHEVTHSLEGTKEYSNLQRIAAEYAKTKGEYDTRVADLNALYEGTNANIENELTSDLIGDYLFTDQEFINQIHTQDRNLFQRIYDEIKHLYKMATAGSKEARQLEQLKHSFEKAMRENKETSVSQNTEYSLSDNKGYHYGDLGKGRDTNYFSMSNTRRSTGHFGTGTYFVGTKDSNVGSLKENRQAHEVDFTNYNLFKPNNYNEAEQLHSLLKDINNEELNAFKLEDSERLFKKSYEELYTAYKKTLATAEEYKQIDEFDQLQLDSLSTVFMKELGYNGIDVRGIEGFDNGTYGSVIYDLKNNNNTQYSLSDNQGRELSKAQQEFFKDSKVRDSEGRLLEVYHGTPNGGFTIFNAYNDEIWVTPSKKYAESYADDFSEKPLYTVYANITNPIYAGEINEDINNDSIGILSKNTHIPKSELQQIADYVRADSLWDITNSVEFRNLVESLGYDGIEATENGYKTYAAFDSNQIKNIDNLNPTNDPDIRYSLSEDNKYVGRFADGTEAQLRQAERNLISNIERLENTVASQEKMNKAAEGQFSERLQTNKDSLNELKLQYEELQNEFKKRGMTSQHSLSNQEQDITPTSADIFGSEIKLAQKQVSEQVQEAIAPLQETIQELNNKITTLQESIAPIQGYTEEDISLNNQRNLDNLEAQNIAPIEDTSPDVTPTDEVINDPFEDRDIKDLRKAKPYMYENPEVKPFFQQAAREMLGDLDNTIPGEKIWIQQLNPDTGMYEEGMVTGTKRLTTDDIAYLKDTYGYKYDQIRAGLNAIIEDNSKEVNKVISKRLEFLLHDRLMKGYKSVDGFPIPPSNEYRALIRDKNIQEYTEQAFAEWNKGINQDELAPADIEYVSNSISKAENVPLENDIAPSNINTLVEQKQASNEPRIENVMLSDPTGSIREQLGVPAAEEMKFTNKSSKVGKTKKQMVGDAWGKLRDQFFNSFHHVDKFSRDTDNLQIKYNADMYNNVFAEIDGELRVAQTDNYGNPIGEALLNPVEEAKANGDYEQLNEIVFHRSNIDRHHVGKGSVVPLEISRQRVAELEKANPRLKDLETRYYRGYKNDLALMQSNGLISGQTNMKMQGMYPHYSPFMFEQDIVVPLEYNKSVSPNKVIKTAKGGAFEILDIEEARIRYTQSQRSAIRKNDLLKEIVKSSDEKISIETEENIDPTDINSGIGVDEKGRYYATAFVDGQPQRAVISEEMYKELTKEAENRIKALEEQYAIITKPLQGAGSLRRNLLTTWSPTFVVTNFLKDFQDGLLNSKYTKDYLKNYLPSFKELAQAKTPEARQFLTLYGSANTWGEYNANNGNQATRNGKFINRVTNVVPRINNIIELAPRFAEYKASLEHGANIQEAMYNAREITLNFGRGGYVAKAMNRNGFTFFNASLQGFDKLVRNFSGENGAKGVVNSLSKVALYGIAPSVFNALAFGTGDDEDEDYKALPDYIKDNYYLIKTDDGEFIRIPKGRMLSIFGSAARRTLELMQGEKDAFEGYLTNAYSQVGVQNPLESNIFAPLIQAKSNKTWYGGDLVPTRLQDKPTEEQYDESTDEFSKWLGQTAVAKKLGISPYKINYVLDQYSGGIGDLILPTITEEANSDGNFLAPIKDKFTANTTFDNKYVSDFYGTRDKMEVKANGSKATEEDLLRSKYLDSVSWEMSELYKEKREVQSNSDLSKAEKFEKVQEIQKQINSLAEEGLNNYENIHKTSSYAQVGDKEFYKDANDQWKAPYDDELEELNSLGMDIDDKSAYFEAKNDIYLINQEYQGTEDTYEDRKKDIINVVRNSNLNTDYKSYLYGKYYSEDTTNIVNMLGMNFDAYLDYETQYFVADKDEAGKSISGSKKKKVFDYINSMDIGFEEKVILAKLEYNSYDEYNHEIINYLNNSDITYDDMVFILKQMGFEVDNEGNIFWD